MKRFLAILTALLLCFPFLSVRGPRALADGNDCFLSASFPSVYNEVLKRDFLTVLTRDPSAGDLQFFPYQLMFRSQSGVSELYATSDGLVRLSFQYDSPDEVGVSGRPASSMVLTIPAEYDSLKQNAYMLSLIHALSQLDPGFSESTATMLMLTAGPSPVTLDVSMGQLSAQLLDGEYTFTLTRSGASVSPPAASDAGNTADLPAQQIVAEPVITAEPEPAVTAPPAAPAPQTGGAAQSGNLILDIAGVQVYYTGISHVVFDQEVDLKIQYVITNNSDRNIVLNIGDASVNGVPAGTVGISIMDPGTSDNDQLYIEPTSSASQQAICSPYSVSVEMTLKDGTNYKELGSYTFTTDVSFLPAVTPRPEAKFPISSLPAETPAPAPAPGSSGSFSALAPGSVIMSASGVEMVFREISYVVFDDEVDLKVRYSITNQSGRDIVMNTGDTFVNGVRANTVGISILKDGESAEDQMYIEPVDTASQQAICNPSSLSVALTIKESDHYQELAAGALNMAVSLPATTPKPNSKFPIDVGSSSSGDFSSGTVSIGDTVMSLSGVEVRYTGIQHVVFDDEVDLKVLYSIVNNSGRDIVLNIEGAQVNGIAAGTVGISILKAGESENSQIYIEPQDTASQQAICNPSSLSIDLLLKDGSSYEELGRTTFRVSDISLPAVTPKPGSKFSSGSVPTPVPRTPSSSVSRPLVFPDNANGQWEHVGSDQLKFRCQVQNVSDTDSIRAFELYLYPTDARGNRLIGADEVYYHTTSRQIHPGQTAYSDYFTIGSRASTANIYVGIKRVIMTDGTVYDYDDVEYWSWTIK